MGGRTLPLLGLPPRHHARVVPPLPLGDGGGGARDDGARRGPHVDGAAGQHGVAHGGGERGAAREHVLQPKRVADVCGEGGGGGGAGAVCEHVLHALRAARAAPLPSLTPSSRP